MEIHDPLILKFNESTLPEILSQYPQEFRKFVTLNRSDIGDHMAYMGTIPRYFTPKEPKHYDKAVHDYIVSRGEEPTKYSNYAVVPRRLKDAYTSVSRYNIPPDPLSDHIKELYNVAFDWLETEMTPFIGGSSVKSYEEIVEWLHPMKSPGLPWTQKYTYKCDYWMGDHAAFYSNYWKLLATEDYIKSLCSVSIKEEVRPVSKIDSGNVRTVIAMDVNHVQAQLQLYLHQNHRMIDSCGKHSMCLGLNLLNGGANRLVSRMSAFGPKSVLEVDGEKFDAKKREYQIMKLERFRFRMLASEWQTEENSKRSRNLYRELVEAPVVQPDGDVFSRNGGNPSGQGCTTPDNCCLNYTDWAVIFLILTPAEYHTYESWKSFVLLVICGDDINKAIHETIRPYYTRPKINAAAVSIGMVYTYGSDDWLDFSDTTFLGHSFKSCIPPGLSHEMFLPHIDCVRMRSNMLVANKDQTIEKTIIRACGLRNETFACVDCRVWFEDLLNWLRDKTARDKSPEIVLAWTNYVTDYKLWRLYTGVDCGIKELQANYDLFEPVAWLAAYKESKYKKFSPPLIAMTKPNKKQFKLSKVARKIVRGKPKTKSRPKTRSLAIRGSRFTDVGVKRFTAPPRVTDYINALRDPFFAAAPKLGFGCFVPTSKHSTWYESTSAMSGAGTGAVVWCVPAVTSSVFIAPYTTAQNNTALSTITYSTSSMANVSTIVSLAQQARVINYAMRIKVRTAGTSLPGTLGFVFLPEEYRTNMDAATPNALIQLPGYRACSSDTSTTIGGEVQYRPIDNKSFEFSNSLVSTLQLSSTSASPQLVAVASGWAASSWQMEISIIGHFETQGGLDAAGEGDNEPDLVDGGITIDVAASAVVKSGEPIITAINLLNALDSANSNITRNRAQRSMSGMIGNLVSGAGNSIVGSTTEQKSESTEIGILRREVENLEIKNKQLHEVLSMCEESDESEQGEVRKSNTPSSSSSFKQSLLQSFIRKA